MNDNEKERTTMSDIHPSVSIASMKNDLMLSQVDVSGPQFGYLTPDMLLDYCSSKLRGIDEQVQRAFGAQQDRNKLSTALGDIANTLGTLKTVSDADDDTRNKVTADFNTAIALAGPNTQIGADLESQFQRFQLTTKGMPGNDKGLDAGETKSYVDSVTTTQSSVNRQGELEMIQLQSLMSQRQQALQMCTNMVSGLGQSSMAIAQNIGK